MRTLVFTSSSRDDLSVSESWPKSVKRKAWYIAKKGRIRGKISIANMATEVIHGDLAGSPLEHLHVLMEVTRFYHLLSHIAPKK